MLYSVEHCVKYNNNNNNNKAPDWREEKNTKTHSNKRKYKYIGEKIGKTISIDCFEWEWVWQMCTRKM